MFNLLQKTFMINSDCFRFGIANGILAMQFTIKLPSKLAKMQIRQKSQALIKFSKANLALNSAQSSFSLAS